MNERYRNAAFLILVGAAFLGIYLRFYPPIHAIQDEAAYLSTAYAFRRGTLYADLAGTSVVSTFKGPEGHVVSKYPPGFSLILAPFILLGWKAAFLANPILLLAGYFLFAWILSRSSLDPRLASLYLLHPACAYYSRTLMADLAGMILVTVALACLLSRRSYPTLAGLFFGLATLVKPPNAIIFVVFWTVVAVAHWRRQPAEKTDRTFTARLLLGFLPPLATLAGYNWIAFGSLSGAPLAVVGGFGFRFFPSHALFYAGILLVLYPLMLLCLCRPRGPRALEMTLTVVAFLLFYSFYGYIPEGRNFLETSVIGQRFLLPILPMFFLAYIPWVEKILSAAGPAREALVVTATALLLVGVFLISSKHTDYLERQAAVRQAIYVNTEEGSAVLCDSESLEFFQTFWGVRKPYSFTFFEHYVPVEDEIAANPKCFLATVFRPEKQGLSESAAKHKERLLAEHPFQKTFSASFGSWTLEIHRLEAE